MILELQVRNISLIPELALRAQPGLTAITGETGAGKSILLGALSLVLGERASADVIRTGCESASVEALFDVGRLARVAKILEEHGLPAGDDQTLLVKREISRTGRGKCWVNGGLSTLAVLEELGQELVDLHGQHEHQSLLHRSRQRELLDAWGSLGKLRDEAGDVYARLVASREARERLSLNEAERMRRLDLLKFQVEEIDAASVRPGEGEQLAEERSRLANAERLGTTLQSVLDILHRQEETAVRSGLGRASEALTSLVKFDSRLAEWVDLLRSAEVQVGEAVDRLLDYADGFEADPARLEIVEERLDLLRKLERKYGNSEEAVLAYREQAALELDSLSHQDEQLEKLAKAEKALAEELAAKARRLSLARQGAGKQLAQNLAAELKELGFARAVFEVRVRPQEDPAGWVAWDNKTYRCTSTGVDEVEFFIGPNPGEEPKPLAKTASGGELSRIMLALKVVSAGSGGVPTLIFDEIDAGIGGTTADVVGRKLAQLAQTHQLVVITHLPQIARFAQDHWVVSKQVEHGRTTTSVTPLEAEARVLEMARLLAGEPVSETALAHARELLERK
jgi:DNA repair protein RecN (Recombination protein N)